MAGSLPLPESLKPAGGDGVGRAEAPTLITVAFSPPYAHDVVLPLVSAAYAVMSGATPTLPTGFRTTALIEADPAHLATLPDQHPATAMTKDTNIFGLMGQHTASGTAFMAFRGSADVADWIADFDFLPAAYAPIAGFGQVHAGFQDIYGCVRRSLAANLPATTRGCSQLLITGHSLGAALAVLAAPDVAQGMPPNSIEPRLTTFGGPRGSGCTTSSPPSTPPSNAVIGW